MRILILMAVLFSATLWLAADNRTAQGTRASHQEESHPSSIHSPFRYVITRNQITEGTRYPDRVKLKLRGVDVLLDAKSFSETTLRQLLSLLSERFPAPEYLRVDIYTNLEDVLTPEEAEAIQSPGSRMQFNDPKYAWATCKRNHDGERCDYHTKQPGATLQTITVR
jgi:hypothetical protein